MSELMEIFMGKSLGGTYILTGANLCTSLLFSIGMSGFVMIIYRLCHDTLTYNRKFNMTLLMLSCISTVLLALIQNNPLLQKIHGIWDLFSGRLQLEFLPQLERF